MNDENKIASRIFSKHLNIEEEIYENDKENLESEDLTINADAGKGDEKMGQESAKEELNKEGTNNSSLILDFDPSDDESNEKHDLDDIFLDYVDDDHVPEEFVVPDFNFDSNTENENNLPKSPEIIDAPQEENKEEHFNFILEPEEENDEETDEETVDFDIKLDFQDDQDDQDDAIDFDVNFEEDDQEPEETNTKAKEEGIEVKEEILPEEIIEVKEEQNEVIVPSETAIDNKDIEIIDAEDIVEEEIEEIEDDEDFGLELEEEEEIALAELPVAAEVSAESKLSFSEEEETINELITDYDDLQNSSSIVKEFFAKNIGIIKKERLRILLEDKEITLVDYKSFFDGRIEEKRREKVYNKMREIEMQFLFEQFIKQFQKDSFIRKKATIDGHTVKNTLVLNSDAEVNVFTEANRTETFKISSGEASFVLVNKLELVFEELIEEIKFAKLNADNVYIIALNGAVVDDNMILSAARYGIKIIKLDAPVASINKSLEELKRKINL